MSIDAYGWSGGSEEVRLHSTGAAVGWAAMMVIDAHQCGLCEQCSAVGTCPRLQQARLELATLGLPHPQH